MNNQYVRPSRKVSKGVRGLVRDEFSMPVEEDIRDEGSDVVVMNRASEG